VLPLLFDEGLPPAVAQALRCLDLTAWAIGENGAPARSSSDEINCQWCESRGAVLVTNDRGKKDRTIFDSIAQHHVHAIFVHNDLRTRAPHYLLRAMLIAEERMDELAARRHGLLAHRLTRSGRLEKR
jgi:hypothetical protein